MEICPDMGNTRPALLRAMDPARYPTNFSSLHVVLQGRMTEQIRTLASCNFIAVLDIWNGPVAMVNRISINEYLPGWQRPLNLVVHVGVGMVAM